MSGGYGVIIGALRGPTGNALTLSGPLTCIFLSNERIQAS